MSAQGVETVEQWSEWCQSQGVNPAEVRLIFWRYNAYRSFYARNPQAEALSLEDWFTFFHTEALSEADQSTPAASECSVDPNARSRGAVTQPKRFFQALKRFVAIEDRRMASQS